MQENANLVLVPAGDRSYHRNWLAGPDAPQFDLGVIYYGNAPGRYGEDGAYYFPRKGFKLELIASVLDEGPELLEQYDRIWLPDDDLRISTGEINLLFELFASHELKIAQPALGRGEVSYCNLRRRPGMLLRYTPFVEVMCPLFSSRALQEVRHTLRANRSGWGIDWLWTTHFHDGEMAIIDKVCVDHMRPLGTGEHYRFLASLGIHPGEDLRAILDAHGIDRRLWKRMSRKYVPMRGIPDSEVRVKPLERVFHALLPNRAA